MENKEGEENRIYPIFRSTVGLKRYQISCAKCKHNWSTASDAWFVTCPSCLIKVRNPKYNDGQ